MQRAQWIGLGLAAAMAVALTAGLVFVIMSVLQPGNRSATATPTPAAVVVSPTTNSSIAAIFGTFTPTPVASPTATPQAVVGQRVQVANTGNEGVNLRRDPGEAGERLTTLREGTVLEIIGPDRAVDGDLWRNVRSIQGEVGWISASFLAREGSVPAIAGVPGADGQPSNSTTVVIATPVPQPTSPGVAGASATRGQVGNTGGQGANIRSEPGTNGRVLKTLNDGSNIEVLGPEREVEGQIWRQVRDTSSGVVGWIIRGAVAPAGSVPTPLPPAQAGPTRAAATAQPGAAATATPKPAEGTTGAPTTAATPKPTTPPGNLPIIIQPATPRPR